jgi:hypothetical protein
LILEIVIPVAVGLCLIVSLGIFLCLCCGGNDKSDKKKSKNTKKTKKSANKKRRSQDIELAHLPDKDKEDHYAPVPIPPGLNPPPPPPDSTLVIKYDTIKDERELGTF